MATTRTAAKKAAKQAAEPAAEATAAPRALRRKRAAPDAPAPAAPAKRAAKKAAQTLIQPVAKKAFKTAAKTVATKPVAVKAPVKTAAKAAPKAPAKKVGKAAAGPLIRASRGVPLASVPDGAVDLIQSFEGIPDGDPSTVNLDAYLDPVGIWTIGWGHAISQQGKFLRGAENKAIARALYPGGITKDQARALLAADLLDTAREVLALAKRPLETGQFGALISFAFNAGSGNLAKSTLLKKLQAGDIAGAADQFLVWNKARDKNGVMIELKGLTRRRKAERAMFLNQDWRAASAT